MKKRLSILTVVLLCILLVIPGCASKSAQSLPRTEGALKNETADIAYGESIVKGIASENRKLIVNTNVQLRVKDVENSISIAEDMALKTGGYVKESYKSENGGRVVLMVPAQELGSFVGGLNKVGKILNSNKSTQDVTDAYLDTEIRIKNLESQIEVLRGIQKRTDLKVSEVLQIENEIRRLVVELEILKSNITNMDRRINYSQVDISFELERTDLSVGDAVDFGYSVKLAFKSGMEFLKSAIIGIISVIFFIIPILPLIALAYIAYRFILKPYIKRVNKQ